jgi:hypothetical protein
MKLLSLALMCSLMCSAVSSQEIQSPRGIRIVNNCSSKITLYKSGWFLDSGAYVFKCDATDGVDTVTFQKGEYKDLTQWYPETESNYIGFWDREVPVYKNTKPCPNYTYDEVVSDSPSTCEDDPPYTGYVSVTPGNEYHLCRW